MITLINLGILIFIFIILPSIVIISHPIRAFINRTYKLEKEKKLPGWIIGIITRLGFILVGIFYFLIILLLDEYFF